MRQAKIYRNKDLAGTLTQLDEGMYEFRYVDEWYINDDRSEISLTLPKTQQSHRSDVLFSFFFNMLSEGANKKLQCRQLQIDENDHFGLLLATASQDTIGAITVQPIPSE